MTEAWGLGGNSYPHATNSHPHAVHATLAIISQLTSRIKSSPRPPTIVAAGGGPAERERERERERARARARANERERERETLHGSTAVDEMRFCQF